MPGANDLLKLEFSEFAVQIGQLSKTEVEKEGIYREYSHRLESILFSRRKGRGNQEQEFKIILGLSLLIACEPKEHQANRLQEVFLDLLRRLGKDKNYAPDIYYMLLCELTYLDQFLKELDLRRTLHDALPTHFRKFPKSPAYTDYDTGWSLSDQYEEYAESTKADQHRSDDLQIILVGSVKGGVGKTLISIALAHHLIHHEKNQAARVALLDLDSSGPTLQYNLDIPDVAKGLSAWREPTEKGHTGTWTYPTFADLLMQIKKTHVGTTLLTVNDKDQRIESRLRAIVLPDSPNVTGIELATNYSNPFESPNVIVALRSLIEKRADRLPDGKRGFNFTHLVIDLGPGLFGTNGLLFTWLTTQYPTSLLLVSSPRAFDLATSLYESVWLSTPQYLSWNRPIMQFLNMWSGPPDKIDDLLQDKTNKTLKKVLAREDLTSTDCIMFWRLREFLYGVAVKNASGAISTDTQKLGDRYNIRALPYDNELRELLHSLDLGPLQVSKIAGTTWYKSFESIIREWFEFDSGQRGKR